MDDSFVSSKDAWGALKKLEAGLHSSISVGAIGRIRKYGSKTEVCKTDEEEAEARGEHFKQLLEREAQYKDGIEDELEQQAVQVKLDGKFSLLFCRFSNPHQ